MRLNKQIKTSLPLAVFASLALAGSANAIVIYSDNFDSTGNLHDTTPDTTTGGVKWIASSQYKADGSYINDTGGSMSLAFTPIDGLIYNLDVSINPVGSDWVAIGYGSGQPTASNYSGVTRATHFLRSSTANGSHFTGLNGTTGLLNWPAPLDTQKDELDLRIELDTTGGVGTWAATWYAKKPTEGSYTLIRAATVLASEDIASVGFGAQHAGSNQTGTLTSFSLSDNTVVPEPTTTALLGLGGLALILRRRK